MSPKVCVLSLLTHARLSRVSVYLPLRGGHPSTSPPLLELSVSFCPHGARKPTYACVSCADLSECMRWDRGTQAERHSNTHSFQLHFIGKKSLILNYFTLQLKVQEMSQGKLKMT